MTILTVKKAIEELQKHPPDAQLVIWKPGSVTVLSSKAISYKNAVAFEGCEYLPYEPWQNKSSDPT